MYPEIINGTYVNKQIYYYCPTLFPSTKYVRLTSCSPVPGQYTCIWGTCPDPWNGRMAARAAPCTHSTAPSGRTLEIVLNILNMTPGEIITFILTWVHAYCFQSLQLPNKNNVQKPLSVRIGSIINAANALLTSKPQHKNNMFTVCISLRLFVCATLQCMLVLYVLQ